MARILRKQNARHFAPPLMLGVRRREVDVRDFVAMLTKRWTLEQ